MLIYFYNLNFIGGQFCPVNYIGIKMVYHSSFLFNVHDYF